MVEGGELIPSRDVANPHMVLLPVVVEAGW